jgi:hypothetical protein
MIFENPSALWLLVVLPFSLLGLGFWGWMAGKETAETFRLDLRHLKRSQVEKYVMAGVLMALLVVALALPKLAFSSVATHQKTGEIALLVDVSASMGAQKDLDSPNRLERVKPMLYEIINRMEELGKVRISLHGFTSMARSHVPWVGKEDYPYLRESIQKVLDINSTPGEGTSLGRPIVDIADKFSQDEKVKIIVLFSDGEAFIGVTTGIHETERGRIEEAIKKAGEQGARVITVGVGEREGAKIPQYDTYGGFIGEYAKLRKLEGANRVVDFVSYLEEEGLEEIASRTGGKYFSEKNREGLMEFIEQNLAVASTAETPEEVRDYRSIAEWFVFGALPLWVIFVRRHLR